LELVPSDGRFGSIKIVLFFTTKRDKIVLGRTLKGRKAMQVAPACFLLESTTSDAKNA
jgi:hypothetical protein